MRVLGLKVWRYVNVGPKNMHSSSGWAVNKRRLLDFKCKGFWN
jgi:hypothetical protein